MTAEEKAREYSNSEGIYNEHGERLLYMGYLAGYNEAIRWRDPKKEPPEQTGLVLTKIGDGVDSVDICRYINGRFKLYYQNQPSDYTDKPIFREDLTECVTGWRPIDYKL